MTGAELRELRKQGGLKAKDLAGMLGITSSTMSRYERDKYPIPKPVEYATRWLCQKNATSPGQRLLDALYEVLENGRK